MRIIIKSIFICGLIATANVYAALVPSDDLVLPDPGFLLIDERNIPPHPAEDKSAASEASQNDAKFEELTAKFNARLNDLEEKNSMMHAKIVQLGERLDVLKKDVVVLKENDEKRQAKWCFYAKIRENVDRMKERLGPKLFTIILASIILVLLALLVYLIVPRRRKVDLGIGCAKSVGVDKVQDVAEPIESNSSKLNLARAYIEMGESSKAKPMLMGVLLHGNDDEQVEAKALLDKIKYGVNH